MRKAFIAWATRCCLSNPGDPGKGFIFDGRIAEDFKLATGTWVSVGPMRAKFLSHCAPYLRDVVFAGHDGDFVAALIFPNVEACRALVAGGSDAGGRAQRARALEIQQAAPGTRDKPARAAPIAWCARC